MPIDPAVLAAQKDSQTVWIQALLARLRDHHGRALTTATAVLRRTEFPEPDVSDERSHELYALEAAVSFAVADANAPDGHAIPWDDRVVATAEVAHFFMAQMQLETNGSFVRQRGGAINRKVISGGTVFDEFVLQPAPEGLVDMPLLKLDPDLLNGVYEVELSSWDDSADEIRQQVSGALHWHSRAWENSPLHTMPDVLVQLKTAIEALSGQHRTKNAIPVLESIYGSVEGSFGEADFLWRANASTVLNVDPWGQSSQVSAFAAWYWNFANLRNSIVHDAKTPEMQYMAAGSPFEGNVFQVAERITRELVKIRLAQLGHPTIALTPTKRLILQHALEQGLADQLTLISPLP